MRVQTIYLIGLKHTGKSSAGVELARRLSRPFLDVDSVIQDLDQAAAGSRRTIRDIYSEDGANRFRQLERAACSMVAARDDQPIVATGGGICDNPEALETLSDGLLVHLVDSFDRLVGRVLRYGIPAFLETEDQQTAHERFRTMYDRRIEVYGRIAHVEVNVTGLSLNEAIDAVVGSVERYLRAGK